MKKNTQIHLLLSLLGIALISGCMYSENYQPSKAISQNSGNINNNPKQVEIIPTDNSNIGKNDESNDDSPMPPEIPEDSSQILQEVKSNYINDQQNIQIKQEDTEITNAGDEKSILMPPAIPED